MEVYYELLTTSYGEAWRGLASTTIKRSNPELRRVKARQMVPM